MPNSSGSNYPAGQPWTEAEHLSFLEGLNTFGKGKWRQISKVNLCRRKTPTQVSLAVQLFCAEAVAINSSYQQVRPSETLELRSTLDSLSAVQVASHAQKYFARQGGTTKRKSRFTVLEAAVHTQSSKHPSFPSSGATSGRPGTALN